MDSARTDGKDAAKTEQREYRGEIDTTAASVDSTTLKFEGTIGVADEDRGSDPYNHTGRFKRLVR